MRIKITEKAVAQIHKKMAGQNLMLSLKYETDGCGCAVNGVPILALVPFRKLTQDEVQFDTNAMPIVMEKYSLIFFDEEMSIDFSEETQAFRLVSPGQILNGRMSLIY